MTDKAYRIIEDIKDAQANADVSRTGFDTDEWRDTYDVNILGQQYTLQVTATFRMVGVVGVSNVECHLLAGNREVRHFGVSTGAMELRSELYNAHQEYIESKGDADFDIGFPDFFG